MEEENRLILLLFVSFFHYHYYLVGPANTKIAGGLGMIIKYGSNQSQVFISADFSPLLSFWPDSLTRSALSTFDRVSLY